MNRTHERAVSAPIPVQLTIFEHKGQLVADSRDVAARPERGHNELMKSIRVYVRYLGEGEIAHSDFFIESTYRRRSRTNCSSA